MSTDFEAWWEKEGQFSRAGGGDYEKTFAFNAWQAARAVLAATEQPPVIVGMTCWQEAELVADVPDVHDALQAFSNDSTADNATGLVCAVLMAGNAYPSKRALAQVKEPAPAAQGVSPEAERQGEEVWSLANHVVNVYSGFGLGADEDSLALRAAIDRLVALAPAAGHTPEPVGWKLVPIKPTQEMRAIANAKHGYPGGDSWAWCKAYETMVLASPNVPAPQAQGAGEKGRVKEWMQELLDADYAALDDIEPSLIAQLRVRLAIAAQPNPQGAGSQPTVAVPLSDEQIKMFWGGAVIRNDTTRAQVLDFARAIEAAHGITDAGQMEQRG